MKNSLVLVLAMVALLVGTATGGTYSGGMGEPNDPYRIATPEDLNDIGNYEEDWDKHFILVNDVNLAQYTGTQFKIIGNPFGWFVGVFDGNYHKIWNFTWASNGIDYVGLFGIVSHGSQIKNLGMENVDVNAVNGNYFGGVVGANYGGTLTNCHSTGSVSGDYYVGGLVGGNDIGTITNCFSSASVSGNESVGGLVGVNGVGVSWGQINNCYSSGTISGSYEVGGLVGFNQPEGGINNSYSTSNVSGGFEVGGLVGLGGDWRGPDFPIWVSGTIYVCFSTGSVSGYNYVGGLVGGWEYNPCYAGASFWDIETSSQSWSNGGKGKTTAEMKTLLTFTSAKWDFTNETANGTNDYWRMCVDGVHYPLLSWQFALSGDFTCPDGVDILDLGFFVERWLNIPCDEGNNFCNCTDINYDQQVDFRDFATFASHWLEGQ